MRRARCHPADALSPGTQALVRRPFRAALISCTSTGMLSQRPLSISNCRMRRFATWRTSASALVLRTRNCAVAIAAARETYPLLRGFVESCKRDYGKFDIGMSHAVHTASTLMAVMGERIGLRELREVLSSVPELLAWLPAADEADRDAD